MYIIDPVGLTYSSFELVRSTRKYSYNGTANRSHLQTLFDHPMLCDGKLLAAAEHGRAVSPCRQAAAAFKLTELQVGGRKHAS